MTTTPREDAPLASPAMRRWCADFDDVALWLSGVSQSHYTSDHEACADNVATLQRAFTDVGISEHEAELLLGGFAHVVGLELPAALYIAGLWAAYFAEKH